MPSGVEVEVGPGHISVSGPRGQLERALEVTKLPNLVLPQIRLLETLAGKAIPMEAAAPALALLRLATEF